MDCLNPLFELPSNKSLTGVKFEYVTAARARSTGGHFDAFVTKCFVFLPVRVRHRPEVSDFRGPTAGDRGPWGTRRGGPGTFEQVGAVFKWQEMSVICLHIRVLQNKSRQGYEVGVVCLGEDEGGLC